MRRPATNTRGGLDVYLFPAVVGGGLGDVEEVLLAGRRLASAGYSLRLFRLRGRPMPRDVEGPWGWPPIERCHDVRPTAARALTVSAGWGVAAAPPRAEPYGRAGPWSAEASEVERVYGAGRVLHVSFEEFGRTLTSREQTVERWREGGVAVRAIRERLRSPGARAEIDGFHLAYRKHRGFDRGDVAHLFTSFRPAPRFRREYPEAIVCGPLWPEPGATPSTRSPGRWVWYASPGSSDRLAQRLADEWPQECRPVRIDVRSPRRLRLKDAPGLRWSEDPPMTREAWVRRFARAELRIVTGSRTLLEALVGGGPFLYFNGVTGPARSPRRHRPEKLAQLLAWWRDAGVSPALGRDLSDFSRGRSLGRTIRRALSDPRWPRSFPTAALRNRFSRPFNDAGALLLETADAFRTGAWDARALVSRLRSGKAGRLVS